LRSGRASVGSFLNVVIYRLPREKSLVSPPSACPSCNTPIRFYNNIPLFSWLLLRGKCPDCKAPMCPDCKAPISSRYFFVELITAILFGGLYLCFFWFQYRQTGLAGGTATQQFFGGGWLFFLVIATLFAVFLAASAIDMELWIIPLELCWFVTIVGFAASAVGEFVDYLRLWAFLGSCRISSFCGNNCGGGNRVDCIADWLIYGDYQAQL
jgi:leader peptidase (prepilin peptidase)/N-methyltransferase